MLHLSGTYGTEGKSPRLLRSPNVVSFPPARNVRLIEELVEAFLRIPAGPRRLRAFRLNVLGDLAQQRRGFGLSTEAVEAEMEEIESAMADQLNRRFPSQRGTRP